MEKLKRRNKKTWRKGWKREKIDNEIDNELEDMKDNKIMQVDGIPAKFLKRAEKMLQTGYAKWYVKSMRTRCEDAYVLPEERNI